MHNTEEETINNYVNIKMFETFEMKTEAKFQKLNEKFNNQV